jgi:LTXXQ motif family protein
MTFAKEHANSGLPSESEFRVLADQRIDLIKAALQLKADQEKYWPPVEEAIRARAMAWHARLENLSSRMSEMRESKNEGTRGFNPVAMLNARADALTQRAAGLKKLADAWQPLYQTLDATQKQRMRILLVAFHHEMKDAVESRMEIGEKVED